MQESRSVFAGTVALKHEINSLAIRWSNAGLVQKDVTGYSEMQHS